MYRRMTALFCCMVLMLSVCIFRVYYVGASDYLAMVAQTQGSYTLNVAEARGGIYDRNMYPLVNTGHRYIAAVIPTPQSAAELLRVTPDEKRDAVLAQLTDGTPFAVQVDTNDLYAVGIDVFKVPQRYDPAQPAPHLVGYLGDEGRSGAAGLEKAYDKLLTESGARFRAQYRMDAAGRMLEGGGVQIHRENENSAAGIVLTIDRDIQLLVQNALSQGCEKGAAVVLDVQSGDIIAMASLPVFDQDDVASSLNRTDAPFINRAISGYNIGSVFKLVVACAALENGFSASRTYECQGSITVGDLTFNCNNHAVHGVIDMQKALQVSCNTYFISLARQLEPGRLLALCSHLGLGQPSQLAPGLVTQSGNLPTLKELASPGALANFSFGQGNSLATPLQIAQVVATIANSGASVTPRLVQGVTENGSTLSERFAGYAGSEVISERTAQRVKQLMIGVIEEGSGRTARPFEGGAGGKTSSAQTGIMSAEGEDKAEIVHAWFAGFYPAENPKYSIVVFVEGGQSGERIAAPIFKQIADGIADLG